MVLKSVLRPSRFGFGNKQVACESSLNSSDNAKDADTSCVASSHKEHDEKDVGDYNGSHSHAGRGGDDVKLKRKPSSSRRVRGLWNERDSCSYFAQLQAEIISDGVFSFLTLEERVISAMTCRRFAYCSQQPGCWAGVDATSYVERLYHAHLARASNELAKRKGCGISSTTSRSNKSPQQLAKEQTSAALVALITIHKNDIERLVVRNIDHWLSSDVAAMGIGACLAVGRLHEIELTDYLELTDSSISVMFLSRFCGSDDSTQTIRSRTVTIPPQSSLAANTRHRGGRKIVSISPRFKLLEARQNTLPPRRPLSTLRLERCPLLTDKAFRLIGANCSDLSKLSLRGCEGITDSGLLAMSPMINCLSHEARSSSSPGRSNPDTFMPSSDTDTSTTHPMLTPPTSPKALGRCMSAPSKPASSSLSSLFETSSPSSVVVASSLPSSPSFLSIFDADSSNTDSGISAQTTASLSLIRHKEVQREIDKKQKRYLSSLDLAHTTISAEGVIALFLSDGDTMPTSVSIDELILSIPDGPESSLKTVSKLRSLLRRPSALNLVISAGAEAEDR